MKILYFNNFNCHNGDLHYYREFIKDIINKTDFDEYYILQNHISPKLLFDIPKLKFDKINKNCFINQTFYKINEDAYINIHFLRTAPEYLHIIHDNEFLEYNSLLDCYYKYYSYIYNKLQIKLDREPNYIPVIDYSKFDIQNIDTYIKDNDKCKVLICNGDSLSAQSTNEINFTKLIEKLSDLYTDIDFILTEKIELIKENVLFTFDIINGDYPDLNEISYLSTFCDIIIGKASGPYCFTLTKDNFNDINKTFIGICNEYMYGFYTEFSKSDRVWINNYDENNIFNVINDEINKKYHSIVNKKFIKLLNISRTNNRIDFSSYQDLYNISIASYVDLNGDYHFDKAYRTYFENISKNVNYFLIIDRVLSEKSKVKIYFFHFNELLHEIIL